MGVWYIRNMKNQTTMKNSQEIIELVEKLSYEEYRTMIKLFQGTGNSEGNIREIPLAAALERSEKFEVVGTQIKVPLENVKRKNHRVDILLISDTEVLAVNSKSNGKAHTLSDHSLVPDFTAYVEGLQRMFSNKKVTYVLARNSDVKHGLIDELVALGLKEWSWDELFEYTATEASSQQLEEAIMELALEKLRQNAQRWFNETTV